MPYPDISEFPSHSPRSRSTSATINLSSRSSHRASTGRPSPWTASKTSPSTSPTRSSNSSPRVRTLSPVTAPAAATAFELARILSQRGASVPCLALFGPLHPSTYQRSPAPAVLLCQAPRRPLPARAGEAADVRRAVSKYFGTRLLNPAERIRALLTHIRESKESVQTDPVLASRARLKATAITALKRYMPTPYAGRVCIFLPNKAWLRSGAAPHRWLRVAPHAEFYYGPEDCNGPLMLEEPDAPAIAELVSPVGSESLNDFHDLIFSLRNGERIA